MNDMELELVMKYVRIVSFLDKHPNEKIVKEAALELRKRLKRLRER